MQPPESEEELKEPLAESKINITLNNLNNW